MITQESFGKTPKGEEVVLYTLTNQNGMKVQIMNYGAIVVRLWLPDGKGNLTDIVEGYDSIEPYYVNDGNFGATIGPLANRTGKAKFTLDGVTYELEVNDGPNNLHSSFDRGYQKRLWKAEILTQKENSIRFSVGSKDMELGLPGNVEVSITYTLTEDNALRLVYHGTSDKRTPMNLTNHSYFNLSGQGSGTILDHQVAIYASRYTEVGPGAIPTGNLIDVTGTALDLRTGKRVGDGIDADYTPLNLCSGYDQNFVIDDYDGTLRKIAEVKDPASGRTMEVFSTLPGVQFYAGNYTKEQTGKAGKKYGRRTGLCLETQYFPDSVNHENFPCNIFGPDRDWQSETVYKFD